MVFWPKVREYLSGDEGKIMHHLFTAHELIARRQEQNKIFNLVLVDFMFLLGFQ